jgi:hypothetical protein
MSWGMSSTSHPNTLADKQLCLQLDDARHSPVAGMALGILDQEGEASHQGRCGKYAPSLVGSNADDVVVGDFLLVCIDYFLHGLVLPIVCGPLWQICSIRRQHLYVFFLNALDFSSADGDRC